MCAQNVLYLFFSSSSFVSGDTNKKYVCICCAFWCCFFVAVTEFYFSSIYLLFFASSSSYVQQLQLMLDRMDMFLSSVNMHFAWFVFPFRFRFFVLTYNNRSRSSLSASLVNESVSVYSSRFRRQHGGSLSSSSSSLQCSNSSLWCSNSIRLGNNVSHPLQLQWSTTTKKITCNEKNVFKISEKITTATVLLYAHNGVSVCDVFTALQTISYWTMGKKVFSFLYFVHHKCAS